MSRHRNVRSLNYEEECDGYDDVYGHSVEDDFCVSPSTAAEFIYDRSQQQQHVLSTFMKKEHEPNIPEEECEDGTGDNSLQDSSSFTKPALNDVQQAQLYSCLEELRSVLGDTTPEHILIDAVLKADFNCEKALDTILCQQEAPKPQREPRKKRDRDDYNSLNSSPSPDSPLPDSPPCVCKMLGDSEQVGHCSCGASMSDVLDNSLGVESPNRVCTDLNKIKNRHEMQSSELVMQNLQLGSSLESGERLVLCRNVSIPGKHDPDSDRTSAQLPAVPPQLSLSLSKQRTDPVSCVARSNESVSESGNTQQSQSSQQIGDHLSEEMYFKSDHPPFSGMQCNIGTYDNKVVEVIDRNVYNYVSHSVPSDQMGQQSNISHEPVCPESGVFSSCPPISDSSSKLNSCLSKQFSLSDLAAKCGTPPNSQPSPIGFSQLAADCGTPLKSEHSYKTISLSQLAAGCDSPQTSHTSSSPIRLSQLASSCGTAPKSHPSSKPVSLSLLAKHCGTPPNSHTSSKPISLSELAASCGTPPKSSHSSKPISLSQLAAGFGSPSNSQPSSSPVTLSQLAAECGTPPNVCTSSKPTSLSELAAGGGSPNSSRPCIPDQVKFGAVLSNLKSNGETGSSSDLACKQTNFSHLTADCGAIPKTTCSLKTATVASDPVLSLDTLAVLSGVKPPPGFKQAVKHPSCTPVKRAPPGFEQYAPKQPSLPITFSLSDLAAKHEVHVARLKSEKTPKSVTVPAVVPVARPSLFAKILCSKFTAVHNRMHKPGSSKFHYNRQASGKKRAEPAMRHITPFDFSTPSPDDIVKTKQKAAFGNSHRARLSADKTLAADLTAKPAIKLSDPVPRVVAAAGADVTQGVARMTFSASKHTTMGFVEPEKTQETKDKVEKTVPNNNANNETAEKAPAGETPKKDVGDATVPKSVTRSKQEKLHVKEMYDKRKADSKAHLNLVVIGHVDAGKSTLMGHVLYQLGFVNKKVMHKHEQEAKKMGKASFAYAWVLDETEEERSRGVTMDIAQTRFETDTKVVTLLDAPGHKDFIPNMITGAAQADVAILVVNATRGEFETGFDMGGQTREHAMLIRSLGVSQLLVAVNKMDTVDWSKTRYDEIVKKLGTFLKQAGFKDADVSYVPCSGLNGENLTKPSNIPELCSWYHGPCVVQQIDKFRPPERLIDKPLRMSVTDIFKGQGAGFSVAGTIQAGCVQPSDKVLVMPQGELATVKGVLVDDAQAQIAFAGDTVILTLVGIEMTNIAIGSIVCDRNEPIHASTRFQARIVIFNIDIPITKGFPVEVHYQSLTEPGQVRRLISQLHKSTGEVIKKKPRCLVKNSNAVVEIEVERPICVELYRDYKDLGRVMLRSGGHTIAAGLVTEVINGKKNN